LYQLFQDGYVYFMSTARGPPQWGGGQGHVDACRQGGQKSWFSCGCHEWM